MIVTGGEPVGAEAYTTRAYDDDGILLWSVSHGDIVLCVAIDANNNVYTGGISIDWQTTRKYDSSGSLLWSVDHGARVNGIAVDSAGNVYTAGERTAAIGGTTATVRKYDPLGNLMWSLDHNDPAQAYVSDAFCIAVDAGYVYVGGAPAHDVWGYGLMTYAVAIFDTDGNFQDWNAPGAPFVYGIAHVGDYHLEVGDVFTYDYPAPHDLTTRLYDPGTTYDANHGAAVYCAALNASGNAFVGGDSFGGVSIEKFDNTCGLLWGVDHGNTVRGIAIDALGNVYIGGLRAGDAMTTRKYDSLGAPIWSVDHGNQVYALAHAETYIAPVPPIDPYGLPAPHIYVGNVKFDGVPAMPPPPS